jgi:hypothetical protein
MRSAKNLSNPKPLGLDEDLYVFNLFRLTGHEEERETQKKPQRSDPSQPQKSKSVFLWFLSTLKLFLFFLNIVINSNDFIGRKRTL